MLTDKNISRKRLPRTLLIVVAVLLGMFVAVLASPVLMPRIIRRNPDWLRRGVFRRYADFRRRRAGHQHSVTALLSHVGRRSRTEHTKHRWVLNPSATASLCHCPTAARPTGVATCSRQGYANSPGKGRRTVWSDPRPSPGSRCFRAAGIAADSVAGRWNSRVSLATQNTTCSADTVSHRSQRLDSAIAGGPGRTSKARRR